ncbi:MAG: aspartate--tRNA(Asn) ligase [Candidatus Paceibacteria bacterium]
MERILIGDLKEYVEKEVAIAGWVSVRRDQGKMVFFDLRDRSGTVQGVVPPKSPATEAAHGVRTEFVVSVKGKVNKRPEKNVNPEAQNGDIELEIQGIEVLSEAEIPFDLDGEVNIDTYLDHQPYTLRSERSKRVFKAQAAIIEAFRKALRERDFVEFQTPALTGGDAEGGAAAFKVDYYYDEKAYLATSPQLYKQVMVGAFERAFTTGKVFRGEKHATPRHLSEYSTLDFEMGFIENHVDVMDTLEELIRDIIERVPVEAPLLPAEKFPVLTLRDVQKTLGVSETEPDLEPEHERAICEWAAKKHGSDFLFVTHYPMSKRPFYTYEDENNPGYSKSFDLLFRGLEISTGGQRVHDYDELVRRLKEHGLDPEKFAFYLETFKVGMPPHGGCATGLERFTARLLNMPNIKEATLFPRDMNRIDRLLRTDN